MQQEGYDLLVVDAQNTFCTPGFELFVAGRRVELHPATDRWMMGDRYGEVVKVEPARVRVRLDKSGKAFWFRREDVLHPGNRNP